MPMVILSSMAAIALSHIRIDVLLMFIMIAIAKMVQGVCKFIYIS
jgi:hypothetical protein